MAKPARRIDEIIFPKSGLKWAIRLLGLYGVERGRHSLEPLFGASSILMALKRSKTPLCSASFAIFVRSSLRR